MTSDLYSIIQFLRNETTSFEPKISTGIGHQNCYFYCHFTGLILATNMQMLQHPLKGQTCMWLIYDMKCQIFAYNMTLLSVCSHVHITYFKNYTTGV